MPVMLEIFLYDPSGTSRNRNAKTGLTCSMQEIRQDGSKRLIDDSFIDVKGVGEKRTIIEKTA